MVQNKIDYESLKDLDKTDKASRKKSKKADKKRFKLPNPFKASKSLLKNKNVMKKIGFTLLIVVVYRLLSSIPLPGIDMGVYQEFFGKSSASEASYLFLIFTGSQLDSPSIMGLGIVAYINASIIIQLMTPVIPKLTELSKDGAQGQQVINQITRYITLPLAFIYSTVYLLVISQRDFNNSVNAFEASSNPKYLIPHALGSDWPSASKIIFMALILTAGTMFLMWLAEAITENGIGNGSSIIISIGIVSSLPTLISQDFAGLNFRSLFTQLFDGNFNILADPTFVSLIGIIVGFLGIILMVVFVNESLRKINIRYARRAVTTEASEESHLPIKLLLTGVLPIIFASALLSVPQLIFPFLQRFTDSASVDKFVSSLQNSFLFAANDNVVNGQDTIYAIVYFILILAFGMFYSFIILKPKDTAENLQKQAAFVPGIRPGKSTEGYISRILLRVSFIGALALGLLALIPLIARNLVISQTGVNLALLSGIGGTSVLIVVSVVLDTMRQYNALKVTRSYEDYA
jgi:preprotein translocase subunit SecY